MGPLDLARVRAATERGRLSRDATWYIPGFFTNTIAVLEKNYRGPQYPALKAAGEEFDKAVNRLRLQCELNIILAVTKTLTNLALAAGASDRALDLLSGKSGAWTNSAPQMPRNHMSWYTEVDIAKVRYRRGCLCMELCFAAENMAMLDGVRNELMYAQALNPGARGAVDKVLNVLETRRKIRELEEK